MHWLHIYCFMLLLEMLLLMLPFGWGPCNCVGMRFALMEAKMALVNILRKYKLHTAPDTEVYLITV